MDGSNRKKRNRERGWPDLPQEILSLVLEKLHLRDQIRLRSVCKNWCLPKDQLLLVKSSDHLPYMVSLQIWKSDCLSQKLQIFCPHAQESYFADSWPKINAMSRPSYHCYYNYVKIFASKHGWLLRGLGRSSKILFLHNPFKNEVLFLPVLQDYKAIAAATFVGNPESPDCEIVVFSLSHADLLFINRYRLSSNKNTSWAIQLLESVKSYLLLDTCCSIHYMNGKIYFYTMTMITNKGHILMCYNLARKSWRAVKELNPLMPERVTNFAWHKYWLTNIGGNLILVVRGYKCKAPKFMAFSFNLSRMCWAKLTDMDGIAIFISGRSILSAPSNDWGCRVFYVVCDKVYCYSFKEKKHIKSDNDLYWPQDVQNKYRFYNRCFVEPPYLRNS